MGLHLAFVISPLLLLCPGARSFSQSFTLAFKCWSPLYHYPVSHSYSRLSVHRLVDSLYLNTDALRRGLAERSTKMPAAAQTPLASRHASSKTIAIDISPPLIQIISHLNAQLAKSGTGPLSIYILGTLHDPDERTRLLESVAVNSILRLLRTNMHRVNTLVVHTHLRSSLQNVSASVRTEYENGPRRVVLYYDFDDLPVEPF